MWIPNLMFHSERRTYFGRVKKKVIRKTFECQREEKRRRQKTNQEYPHMLNFQ